MFQCSVITISVVACILKLIEKDSILFANTNIQRVRYSLIIPLIKIYMNLNKLVVIIYYIIT